VTCSGFSNVDLRFSKTLVLQGSHRIELIAQLFNVANHANFSTPINNLASPAFGQATQLQPYINAPFAPGRARVSLPVLHAMRWTHDTGP